MFELISVPPVVQGALVVVVIFVLAMGLYAGYAIIERFLGDRMLQTLDDV